MTAVLVELGAVPAVQTSVLVLAQNPAPPPGQGEEFGKASPVGLVVIVLLALATIVLIRSMTKRLKRLPASFDRPESGASSTPTPGDPRVDPVPREGGASRDG